MAVLGDNVRKQLFGDRPVAPGASVALNGLPYRIVGLMPPKDQNSSYNGLDSDKIFVPYSAMVRDLPLADENFHPGIVSDLIYVPASLDRAGKARATRWCACSRATTVSIPTTPAPFASGTPWRTPNWWTTFSLP